MRLKPVVSKKSTRLADRDARVRGDVKTGAALERASAKESARISNLQRVFYADARHALLIVLQGRDAAGKDGTVKHVAGFLNPRGVQVVSFGVPTPEETQHDFLWRVHRHAPRLGEFAIFNRSHYEDVLVVRVHDLVPKKLWKKRYDHIAGFESLLAEHNTIVLKYFLHITKAEQKDRLLEREQRPETAWKLNADDWREREYWDEYTEAYEDAISKTACKHAPWTVVPANAKWYRNLVVAESIAAALRPHRDEWFDKLKAIGKERREALRAYRGK